MSKRNHLKERLNEKLEAITFKTLIVGVDIAKHNQWARFVDCRGIEHNKALKFENNRNGFNAILARIYEICKQEDFNKVIVGMEPTGHYWKAFANFLLKQAKITVVLVNPYHTKKAKELDDNSQTKSDKKDALTIARLVKDGRYFETYLPHDVYAELRGLTTTRYSMNKRKKSIINTITAVLDEYFPEFGTVFKQPFKGKASMHLLKVCPIPKFVLELGEDGVLDEIKKAVKKTVGRKKAAQLVEAAKDSIGVDYGEYAARFKIQQLMEELELITSQLEAIEAEMAETLKKTEISEYLLSITGMGVVSLATCLGELGDPLRFCVRADDPQEAYYILTPHMMEYILTMADKSGGTVYMSFLRDGKMHVAVKTERDFFELGKSNTDVGVLRQKFLDELRWFTDILDTLRVEESIYKKEENV